MHLDLLSIPQSGGKKLVNLLCLTSGQFPPFSIITISYWYGTLDISTKIFSGAMYKIGHGSRRFHVWEACYIGFNQRYIYCIYIYI